MPGIGETLREARMRRKIDMTEVEAATKIRAKYLRALENEEWDALPGTTFVKTFLRTYADYLQLDSKRMVEEYRQRYERPSTVDLAPIAPVAARAGRRPRRGSLLSPGVVLALGALVLIGALYLLGTWGDDDEPETASPNRVEQPRSGEPTPTPESERSDGSEQRRRATRVRLQIVPTGTVWVCLVDASGRELVEGRSLSQGDTTDRYRSRRFRVTFGNGNARMRVDGRSIDVPDRDEPVGYDLRPGRRPRELDAEARPTCA